MTPRKSLAAGLLLAFVFAGCVRNAFAIPAFARKYGLPCSACHEGWPKLNSFGQKFKDEGYQLGNEKDSPIYQNPTYWPVAMRITPHGHYESLGLVPVDTVPGDPTNSTNQTINTSGFDLTGITFWLQGRWPTIFRFCWCHPSIPEREQLALSLPTYGSTTSWDRRG